MKNIIPVSLFFASAVLLGSTCDDGDTSFSADDPKSVCEHIFDQCGKEYYGGKTADCVSDLKTMEQCRLEGVLDITDCELIHDCLYYSLDYGIVTNYCTPDGKSKQNGGGSGDSLEDCAKEKCASQNSACQANSDCVAIFEVCYPSCAQGDLNCIAACAMDYLGGVNDHDALIACLEQQCS